MLLIKSTECSEIVFLNYGTIWTIIYYKLWKFKVLKFCNNHLNIVKIDFEIWPKLLDCDNLKFRYTNLFNIFSGT